MFKFLQGAFAVSDPGPGFTAPRRGLRARLWTAGRLAAFLLTLAFLLGLTGSNPRPLALAQEQPPQPACCSKDIAITPDGRTLLVVNPDSNSLTLLDTADGSVLVELPVGVDPRSVAVSQDGLWACVACQGSDSVSFIDLTALTVAEAIAVGDRPVGVAVSPQGGLVAIAELGDDQVRLFDAGNRSTRSVVAVGDRPHGLAFTPDGRRLLVTHLLSGDVTVLTLEPWALCLPIIIKNAASIASQGTPRTSRITYRASRMTLPTWPNIAPAPSVLVNLAGTRAYLPQTMAHGLGLNTQFDNTVFPKVSVLNLATGEHEPSEHISLPETDQPVGLPWDAALARADSELWVVNAASNDLSVIDISAPKRPRRVAHLSLGANPRGIVLHPDGQTAYVNNTLEGTVSVIDTQAYTITSVVSVTQIPLPPVLLQGKRLFHSSATPELAQARWISCNTCHIEGEHDGRTWLLQYNGEVPPGSSPIITRNTTSLLGMVETYPLRWSAEWDESADSESSIRFEQFGTGLIDGDMHPTLGPPNQGRSWDLDCLASFIDSLLVPERYRELTQAEERGQALFQSPRTGCLPCHPPPLYTDLKPHDVGTAEAYGEWFGPLIDTPTLRFLYDSAPYLHDGTASTLHEVLTTENTDDPHGMASLLSGQEIDDLVAFLLALPAAPGEGYLTYQASSCLGEPSRARQRIDIWVEGRDIVMAHHDAVYNCCAQMVVYLEDQRPLLKLIEQEEYGVDEPCRCQCTYELAARIANLPLGKYIVQVWNGAAQQLLAEQTVAVHESR
jgi:YVTN family beta-propeller protein